MSYDQKVPANAEFWNQVKGLQRSQLQLDAGHDVRVVLAAAYGTKRSSASAPDPTSPLATPVRIENPDAVITVFPSQTGASLQLQPEEWDELWDRYLTHTSLQLGTLIKDHIAAISGSQVGSQALARAFGVSLASCLMGS